MSCSAVRVDDVLVPTSAHPRQRNEERKKGLREITRITEECGGYEAEQKLYNMDDKLADGDGDSESSMERQFPYFGEILQTDEP